MLLDWVKRLGQWHYVKWADSSTLCGQHCLGNNYSKQIPIYKREPCLECHRIAKEQGLLED